MKEFCLFEADGTHSFKIDHSKFIIDELVKSRISDGFVKSFSRPFMAKYPKGTMFRCQFLLFRQPDASVNEAVRTLVP